MYRNSLDELHERQVKLLKLIDVNLEWGDVTGLLLALKRIRKQTQCLKIDAQAPSQEQLAQIRNDFEPLESSAEHQEEGLKARVLQENTACAQRRDAAIQEANAAYERQDLEAVQEATLRASEAELKLPAGISLRQQLRIDIADKALVPIEYLKTDDAKIRASKQEIPGIIKRHELIVAVRTEGEAK